MSPRVGGGDRGDDGGGVHDAGEIEVSDLDAPVLVHEQVGALQVAVQHTVHTAVQVQHPLRRFESHVEPPGPAQLSCCSLQMNTALLMKC